MRNRENTGSVLVVEDDSSARDQLRAILTDGDYRVFEAQNGTRALDLLRKVKIDTVTLDPWLPGIQGRELLTRIREVNPRARVIIVTGHRLSLWFDDMVREEVFDYLPKPIESRELLRSVKRSMVRREALAVTR